MFEKTLSDIVKGIRASKRDTALYISQCIADIKKEINSTDRYVKSNALNKLTFLQMMGYGMSWASFASIEVMSSPRFAHKRIGYLAAQQGFTQDTEVILLTTNLLKKELRGAVGGNGVYEAGLAINCISNIVTEDLGRDLLPELTNLTNHPQPYLRKKAVLCLFKVFCKYPQGLRLTFDKIQQCLEDSSPSVVSCSVNVVTELSDKNPKNYLHLAPAFFSLLTTSQNNWMLIKVVKLLGSLVPEEPRLARKLLEPLAGIVQSTQAKSLLYEAVYTITLCLPYCRKADGSMPASVPRIVQLCGSTLKDFSADTDPNLKYLGLVGFSSLMISHPKVLVESDARPLILACLSDDDVTIRTRALDLLRGMTTRKNLQELVGQLMKHVEMASGQYKKDLVLKIIELCSGEKYALLQDFAWYLDVLLKLSYVSEDVGEVLEKQITDISLRVLPVRAYAVQEFTKVLLGGENLTILPQVLPSMAWAVGEYSNLLEGNHLLLVQALTKTSNTTSLVTTAQAIYLHAAMKVFAAATQESKTKDEELIGCVDALARNLPVYMQSLDFEVQERAFTSMELLRALNLLPSTLGVPGLVSAEDGEEDDDDEDDDAGDLLQLGGPSKSAKPNLFKASKSTTSSSPLPARCRKASTTLNYILKPEPMKPISAKAQKKKRLSPVGIDVEWLNQPVNMEAFGTLFDDVSNSKPSMEQVNFTQQRLMQITSPTALESAAVKIDISGFGSTGVGSTGAEQTSSFQKSVPEGENLGLNQQRSSQDPFYLDVGPQPNAESQTSPSRFGTIQLGDSGDDEPGQEGKKKKKKKKGKKGKVAEMGAADVAMFASLDTSTTRPVVKAVTMYESDEDDDDDDVLLSMSATKKRSASKEFAGLASVDLTTPLREDEVMPRFEHRTVPQRPSEPASKSQKKKKKKKEGKKGKKAAVATVSVSSGVGDLLDLGGFASVADVSNPAVVGTGQQQNKINSAFDDLLGLDSPSPALPVSLPRANSTATQESSGGKKAGKKPWMKCIVKAANSEGSVDWTRVTLYCKALRQSVDKGVGATLVFRIKNELPSALPDVTISLKGIGDFRVGSVDGGGMAESSKIGPIPYDAADSSQLVKGFLVTGQGRVPVKASLPATLHLSPSAGLTLENVMEELSSSQFFSRTVKLQLETLEASKAKPLLVGFFRAAEVDSSGPLLGTLASQSRDGNKVRVLVKVQGTTAKVDIKCSNEEFLKALATDLKKLVV